MTYRRVRGVLDDELPVLTGKPEPEPTASSFRRTHHGLLVASAIAVAGVLLAACGSDDSVTDASDTTERGNTVEVDGTDQLAFEPDELTIPAGEEVTLELTAASVEHDFVVEGATEYGTAEQGQVADNPDDLHVAHADAGETATATFTIERAGTYTVYCSVPGHRDAGMVASLEVVGAEG